MKKILSTLLIMVMITSSIIPVFAENNSTYEESGKILEDLGVLKGSQAGDLMLNSKFKRQDMVVLISRLYGKEDKAKTFPVKNNFKDLKDKFYLPYISWAVDEDLIKGMTEVRFGYGEYVTVQQFQTVLLRVLGYNTEASNWDKVSDVSKDLGIMKDIDVKSNIQASRGLMAQMTVNALRLNVKNSEKTLADTLNLKLPGIDVSSKSTVENDTLTITGNIKDAKVVKAILTPVNSTAKSVEKTLTLQPNGDFTVTFNNLLVGDYDYKFDIDGKISTSKRIIIDSVPFELINIVADNLREIHLSFTNPIDSSTALFINNYSTDAGTIGSVRLENNDKKIILSLETNKTMINQKTYKLNAQNISSKTGQSLVLSNEEFTVFDNSAPIVNEVKALGNQRIKITLSEPVKFPSVSNFKIDDKRFSGRVQNKDNIITLILPTNQVLDEGTHSIDISSLEDFAGYKAPTVNMDFKVIRDNNPPEIKNHTESLEEILIEFDKEIDENSINRTNFYWMSGSSKRYPDTVSVEDTKLRLSFSGNNTLPTHETKFYIFNIKDYFGNVLKNAEFDIKAKIDSTSPKVLSATPSDDGKVINVVYSKNVKANDRSYYKLTDKNGKNITIRSIEGSGRTYQINLGYTMPIGINKLEINDVRDTTALQNTLIPYSKNIEMGDVETPKIVNFSGSGREIILMFNKDMNLQTVTDPSNYLVTVNNSVTYLPNSTEFEPIGSSRTILIKLPSSINGTNVSVGPNGSIKELQVVSLKAENGVPISPTNLKFTSDTQGEATVLEAKLKEPGLIEVNFSQPIQSASTSDFNIAGSKISSIQTSGDNLVKIFLDSSKSTTISNQLEVRAGNSMTTLLNTKVKGDRIDIKDEVAPKIEDISYLQRSPKTIYLPFTEDLDTSMSSAYQRDLYVEKLGYGPVSFSTTVYKNEIRIYINNETSNDEFLVRLIDRPTIISDKSGNVVESDSREFLAR